MTKKAQKTILKRLVSKEVITGNETAFRAYETYKKAAQIIERADFASGKRVAFKSDAGSTLNFEINRHGTYSTTAQSI